MKKLLLLSAGLALTVCLQAQQRPVKRAYISPEIANKAVPAGTRNLKLDSQLPLRHAVLPSVLNARSSSSSVPTEYIVAGTEYDLQSNRSTANRISNNGDGTISVVWTGSADRNGWPDRGSWYSYYDGSTWNNSPSRIEPVRTGFTNIDVAGGIEYVLAHDGSSIGQLSTRTKGTGAWTTTGGVGGPLVTGGADVWFRMAVAGPTDNTVHVIVNSQGSLTTPVLGQNGPITYSRSLDGGATWDIQHQVLPGLDATNYWGFSAEDYHIDARGNTVAIVLGGFTNDVVLMKSTDNGTTWTKTVIAAFPDQAYMVGDPTPGITDPDGDGIADTLDTNGGDVTVSIDNNGLCHVSYSYMRTLDDDPAAVESYFPGTDGLLYWNENMTAPDTIAFVEDLNGDGTIIIPANAGWAWGLYNTGLTTHPSIGFDANNNIFISYATLNEFTDTVVYQAILRHPFVIASTDGGASWSTPLGVVPMLAAGGSGEYEEGVWPSIAKLVDNNVHILYQRDIAPGHSISGDQAPLNTTTNDIVYVGVPVTDLVGVNEISAPSKSFTISQNYPNPFNGTTSFEVNLLRSSDLKVQVYNVLGKLVKETSFFNMQSGVNVVTIDANDLSTGLYTYTVTVGSEKLTKTMMVK